MLNQQQLELAITIQQQSYELLRWLGQAMNRGFVHFHHGQHYGSSTGVAREWLNRHLQNFPSACRPDISVANEFANFFSTYLETSFDIHATPKPGRSRSNHCGCAFCSRLNQVSHLMPKAVGAKEKKQAEKLRKRRLALLCHEENIPASEELLSYLLHSPHTRHDVTLSTYGWSLIARLSAISYGTGVLVLWRDLAWNGKGSPRTSFKLQVSSITKAESNLLSHLKTFHLQSS